MSQYVYFSDDEIKGLLPDVCYKLDRARELFGNPIEITCGFRTPEHNLEIRGVKDSAHTKGMAVDIKAPLDLFQRTKLAWALGSAGFRRLEICPKHYHVDIDTETKPSPACFEGEDH